MKNLISYCLTVLLLAVSISAQENSPKLIDEFGTIPLGELMARIDALGIEVGNSSTSRVLIRISGGQEVGLTHSYRRGSTIKGYWEKTRMFPADRLLLQFCNISEKSIFTQFFVVEAGDDIENCEERFVIPKVTTLYQTVGFYSPEFELTPQENTSVEYGFQQGVYSGFALDVLKKSLNDSPESKVYIIGYLKTNFETDDDGKVINRKRSRLDKKIYVNKMFQAARNELLKNGFMSSQIVTIDGGYINGQERSLEFWFVPQNGEIPKPKPDYVPTKSRKK